MTSIGSTEFAWVSDLVRKEAAIVLQPGKEYLVEARLLPLARAHSQPDTNAFVRLARQPGSMALRRAVIEALTTNETSWFRDATVFEGFRRQLLPEITHGRSAYQPLRIWSAASSTGQEAYSLAILLTEELGSATRYEITGTDLASGVLEQAKLGKYSQMEMNRGLPARYLVQYFRRVGAGWQINPELQRNVRFRELNLATPFPPGLPRFDVVFLRNVLIYFDLPTKRTILQRVKQVMTPGGYLILGTAETTRGIDDQFELRRMGGLSAYQSVAEPSLQLSGRA